MKIETCSPETFVRSIVGDVHSHRGAIVAHHLDAGSVALEVGAPLGQMFRYANTRRALSNGHPSYTMTFDHYDRVLSSSNGDDNPWVPPALGMRA